MSTDQTQSCCGGSVSPEPVKKESSCCGSENKETQSPESAGSCCSGSSESGVGVIDPAMASLAAPAASSCCGTASAAVATQPVSAGSCCGASTGKSAGTSAGTASESGAAAGCCDTGGAKKTDWIFVTCAPAVAIGYAGYFLVGDSTVLPAWLTTMFHTSHEMVNAMWWGILSAAFFVGLLGRIPRELVMSVLGKGGTGKGVVRATIAGLMLDLCNHGILMVGMKLYERGASIGQVMAFLIASPWNSLTLTLILVGLIGLQWTLLFIAASMVIAWISGLIFDLLVRRDVLPANPHQVADTQVQFMPALKQTWAQNDWSPKSLGQMFWQGLKESKTVLRWVVFGVVLVALLRAFVPEDSFGTWFGATFAGLLLTLLATTLIEVCSEGSSPIAADLFNRAGAPGNAFTFLMAGAATDYTEIMSLKDTTHSWKIALFLPLVTVPQVLLIGWLMNLHGA